jgi:hypothetical protein
VFLYVAQEAVLPATLVQLDERKQPVHGLVDDGKLSGRSDVGDRAMDVEDGPWPSCSGTSVTPELCQASNPSRYQILPPRVRVPKTVANPQTSRSGFIISAPPTARPTAA